MDAEWCAQILKEAVETHGNSEIISSVQGSQFTSEVLLNTKKST